MEEEHRRRLRRLNYELPRNITDCKGVISGLYAEGILTDLMKEKVEQKMGSDQIWEILDILPKRGERAFEVFYQVLVKCGEDTAADLLCPELADQRRLKAALNPPTAGVQQGVQPSLPEEDELPANWPDSASHDPLRVEVVPVPEENSGMKALFDKAVVGSGSVYAMHKPIRGVFLLINNEHFEEARAKGVDLEDRSGTGKDCIALQRLFKQLNFRVETKVNLSAERMLKAFQQMADEVEDSDNCFACAVLTHGERGAVYGVDGDTVTLDELRDAVADNCQMLIGKPKVFFIQACQGKKMDGGALATGSQGEGDAASNTSKSENEVQELTGKFAGIQLEGKMKSDAASKGDVSSKSDIFIAMATVPDFESWRNTEWGSWFVQAIVYIFSRFAHKYEINQLMTMVNKLVSQRKTAKGFKQASIYSSSLTRNLYFFPGLQHGLVESHAKVDSN